jgi:hypothetical protein
MFHRFENNRPRLNQSEIVISIVILLVFILIAMPFFNRLLENIERTSMQQIIRQLNAAANIKMAEYVALDKLKQFPEQLRSNPVNWLDVRDLNGWDHYQGEVELLDFEQLEEQHWVYDKSRGRLIYKIGYPELLINNDPIQNRIQFKVKMDYIDFNRSGKFDATTDTINGLVIEAVYPFRWKQHTDD